jgi:hypothetical protein
MARSEFTGARADRQAKGRAAATRKAQKECGTCWTVGGHDPRCPKVAQTAAMRARKAVQP